MSPDEILEKREELAAYLLGTCHSFDSALEYLELADDVTDYEDELLSANVEICLGCGWWHESGDLVHDDEANTGYCEDCI
jgi:hypothetical protein